MAQDVFISYSSKDKPVADALTARLEQLQVRCWIAPRDILPGMDWGEAIVDAIASSRVMVLILSGNSNVSPQIRREVERAVHREVVIIPFVIERTAISKSLEYFISTPHWLDAVDGQLEQHVDRLAETVRALISRPRDVASATALSVPPAVERRSPEVRRSRGMNIVAIAVFLVLSGTAALWLTLHHSNTQDGSRVAVAPRPSAIPSAFPASSPANFKGFKPSNFAAPILAFSPDGRFVAHGAWKTAQSPTGEGEIWDMVLHSVVRKVRSRGIHFSPDGKLLAVLEDNNLTVSQFASGDRVGVGTWAIGDFRFSPDGRFLVYARANPTGVSIISLEAPQPERNLVTPGEHYAAGLSISPDSNTIAMIEEFPSNDPAAPGGVVSLWRFDGDMLLWKTNLPTSSKDTVLFSPDGRLLLCYANYCENPCLLDSVTGRIFTRLTIKGARSMAFSGDGSTIITASDHGMRLWDVILQKERGIPTQLMPETAMCLTTSADGLQALVGYADGSMRLIDLKTLNLLATLKGAETRVLQVALSHDGCVAASVGEDAIVRLWNVPRP